MASGSSGFQYNEEPWTYDNRPKTYDIPPIEGNPWKKCHEFVKSYDDGMVGAWKAEVENMLIFAGLFSAVVTAFAVESYKGLQTDPSEVQIILLAQIATQLGANASLIQTLSPTTIPSTARSLNVQINVLLFLSLALSLSTVLIGVICLQWLREYIRDIGVAAKEAVAIRQMRHEGLQSWHVPEILSTLPVLLQVSLVLFFIGLLRLLWSLDNIVAALVTVAVALTLLFLAATIMIPTFQNILLIMRGPIYIPQCPYKSPQSWMFHRLTTYISCFLFSYSNGINADLEARPFAQGLRIRDKRHMESSQDENWGDYDSRWYKDRNYFRSYKVTSTKPDHDSAQALCWIENTYAATRSDAVKAIAHCIRDISMLTKDYVVAPREVMEPIPYSMERNEMALTFFLEKYAHIHDEIEHPYIASLICATNNDRLSIPFKRSKELRIFSAPDELVAQYSVAVIKLLKRNLITKKDDLETIFAYLGSSLLKLGYVIRKGRKHWIKIHFQLLFEIMDQL